MKAGIVRRRTRLDSADRSSNTHDFQTRANLFRSCHESPGAMRSRRRSCPWRMKRSPALCPGLEAPNRVKLTPRGDSPMGFATAPYSPFLGLQITLAGPAKWKSESGQDIGFGFGKFELGAAWRSQLKALDHAVGRNTLSRLWQNAKLPARTTRKAAGLCR